MNIQPLIDRLTQEISRLPIWNQIVEIGGAADLDAALRGTVVAPSIYVMPMADRPVRPGDDIEGCAGGRFERFSVLQVVAHVRDAKGGEALAELPAVRRAVAEALRGWVPGENCEPMQFLGGQLVQFAGDGRLWWSDEYGNPNFGLI